jgi:beta-galactosidase
MHCLRLLNDLFFHNAAGNSHHARCCTGDVIPIVTAGCGRNTRHYRFSLFILMLLFCSGLQQAAAQRTVRLLNDHWLTIASDSNEHAYDGFEQAAFPLKGWQPVSVPHNWDTYGAYRRMKHGNRHGYAWYRRTFRLGKRNPQQRQLLFFEGVGSYATVYLNGRLVGQHAGGRTTFTLDITDAARYGQENILAVKAGHPAFIKDLPWVCGGCSNETGFSEGSQPMGIFRPVSLITTGNIRVAPFGVHIWNDTTVTAQQALLHLSVTLDHTVAGSVTVENSLYDRQGKRVAVSTTLQAVHDRGRTVMAPQVIRLSGVHLWNLEDPYRYRLVTRIITGGKCTDRISTPYGIRRVSWPVGKTSGQKQFLLNGQPVFINGTAEYEHALGNSGAFSRAEIQARVAQVKAAGYNAFRDAHQPHNLQYQESWDSEGLLWWPQFSAHIYYNTPAFKAQFKQLLTEWIMERRNSPSNILWGLQNESVLEESFARECCDLIRSLDPTASTQRLITTCNGGKGTDWDVPQNWTGTYGGDQATYGSDLIRQVLVGEYGAWRSLDLHDNSPLSETYMTQLMETKLRLADSVKDQVAGHFHWLLYSHENPGRAQSGEGYREIDRIGPVNYKGLFTIWGEPADAFYLFRSRYANRYREPMVYIVSHTNPGRWTQPGFKDSIVVYSNCEEVALYDRKNGKLLGRQRRTAGSSSFVFNQVNIQTNLLYAAGYVNGQQRAEDALLLQHLPAGGPRLANPAEEVVKPQPGWHYLYRVNCGGDAYTDADGNQWSADRNLQDSLHFGSVSWGNAYAGVNTYFASQRVSYAPVHHTAEWPLFQSYRYGREALQYAFPVPDGEYLVELYFQEPWYGAGNTNSKGWRLFDVAVNGKTVLKDLDIWQESTGNTALKKTVRVQITGGRLVIGFPQVKAAQALICAIAIAGRKSLQPAPNSRNLVDSITLPGSRVASWLQPGDRQFANARAELHQLPPELAGADWIYMDRATATLPQGASLRVSADAEVYVGLSDTTRSSRLTGFAPTGSSVVNSEGTRFILYKQSVQKGQVLQLPAGKGTACFIAAVQATAIDPAYDLKKSATYKADRARFNNAVEATTLNGKAGAKITGRNARLSFAFAVGVANVYSIRFRYSNETDKTFLLQMRLVAADGTVMKTEQLRFAPYIKGKFGTLDTSTGFSINAGNYTIELVAEDAAGLGLSAMEVQ